MPRRSTLGSQSEEEIIKRFERLCEENPKHEDGHCKFPVVNSPIYKGTLDFILQERQRAYEEGYEFGHHEQNLKIQAAKEKAVKETLEASEQVVFGEAPDPYIHTGMVQVMIDMDDWNKLKTQLTGEGKIT